MCSRFKLCLLELSGIFPPDVFHPRPVESVDAEPADAEGRASSEITSRLQGEAVLSLDAHPRDTVDPL